MRSDFALRGSLGPRQLLPLEVTTMIASPRGTAKIYSFPAGGRDGAFTRTRVFAWTFAFDETKNGLPVLSSRGWYHDDAICRDAHQRLKP